MGFPNDSSNFRLEQEVTQSICKTVDSPRSLAVSLLLENREWDQLLSLEINPSDYNTLQGFRDDYLVTKVISKSNHIPTGIDLREKALEKFYEGEELCKQTNVRLAANTSPPLFHKISELVEQTIGNLSKRDLDFIETRFRHGPGATFGTKGMGSVRSDKYRQQPTLTANLVSFARCIMGARWADQHASCEVVKGNRFTSVPKTSKTDRGICIEPMLNVYTQLGVGELLKRKLLAVGCNLRDQTHNQFLAQKAKSWELATIDLSLASDTISSLLVFKLLPPRWFELLDLLRSHKTILPDGTTVSLEKFSSMGNGFTFELESLIFLCIAKAIVPKSEWGLIGVYGDDIVVPQRYANQVIEGLKLCGFVPNKSKTCLAGAFFESCGTDWFNDKPVRPFYLKQECKSLPYALQVANRLRLYSERVGVFGCDSRWRPLWLQIIKKLPKDLRGTYVPKSAGDVGLIVSQREALSRFRRHKHWEGFLLCRRISLNPLQKRRYDIPLLLCNLASSPEFSLGMEPVRGYLGRCKTVRTTMKWTAGFEWT